MASYPKDTGFATPAPGMALGFDGIDDYVDIEQVFNTTNWSLSVWVKSASLSKNQYILDTSDKSVSLICGFQNGFYNIYGSGYATGDAADTQMAMSAIGTKDHVVYVKNGTNLKGYLNGVLTVNVTITTGDFTPVSHTFRIGRFYDTLQDLFQGELDELLVYCSAANAVLTQDEVTVLYTGELPGSVSTSKLRATQLFGELVGDQGAALRASTTIAEVAYDAGPAIRSSGTLAEVVYDAGPDLRMSTTHIDVVYDADPDLRITQYLLEVIYAPNTEPEAREFIAHPWPTPSFKWAPVSYGEDWPPRKVEG